jgi:hypothetical protein
MSGGNEKAQSDLIGKHAAYFRGKTRHNPEEILGLHVLAVGGEGWPWRLRVGVKGGASIDLQYSKTPILLNFCLVPTLNL